MQHIHTYFWPDVGSWNFAKTQPGLLIIFLYFGNPFENLSLFGNFIPINFSLEESRKLG